MALIRWRPRTQSLLMDPFFSGFEDLFRDWPATNGGRSWYPPMDLVDEKHRLVAHLELPGVDPKSVQIDLQGEVLTVSGSREDVARETKDGKVLKREHSYGAFQRSVELPYRVKADDVKATYRNGVMTISLPKAEEHVGRQIPVEVK
jgi:HSP20 family protein